MGMEGWQPFSALMVYRSPSAHVVWAAMGPIRLEDRFHKYSTTGEPSACPLKCLISEVFLSYFDFFLVDKGVSMMGISNLSSSAKLMRRTRTAVELCLWLTLLWGQQKIYFIELLLLMVSTKDNCLLKVRLQWHSLNLHVCFLCFPPVDDIPELLSSSSLFSMLLPLILAYIGPVAASVPKVESGQTLNLNLFTYLFPVWNSNAMPPPLPSGCSRSLCAGSGSVTSGLCSQPKICPTHLQSQPVNWQHNWQPAWAGPLSLYHLQPLFSNRKWPSLQAG